MLCTAGEPLGHLLWDTATNAKKFMMAELPDSLFNRFGHKNVKIADNYVKEAGGDGHHCHECLEASGGI
ncbi:MAG: hypothetical protein V8R80_08200 [Eubacterium sp.]